MNYVFAYHRNNTDDYTRDCVIDIIMANSSNDIIDRSGEIMISYICDDNPEEVEQLKREAISKAEFESLYGPIPYP